MNTVSVTTIFYLIIINPKTKEIMYHAIKLMLHVPNGLNISGKVQCEERTISEYQVSHKIPGTDEEIKGPHYEIEISSILSQIISEESANNFFKTKFEDEEMEKKRRKELVTGRHILIGKDFLPYVCCPRLPEAHLMVMTKYWLVHQALFSETKHNIVNFEYFLRAGNPNFEDWLENNPNMKDVPTKEKDFILSDKALYMKVKELYEQEKSDGEKRWLADYLADSILKMLNATASIELL